MSMHPGITILDEGHPRSPSTASLPSVWAELTPGAARNSWQSHTCLLCCLCLNQTRGGLNQDQRGPQDSTWGPGP